MKALIWFFLRVGATSFGKLTATNTLYTEYVEKAKKLSKEEFFALNGFLRLFPGPTQTQTSIALGCLEFGWKGGIAAGLSYLLPSFALITLGAYLYFEAGEIVPIPTLMLGLNIISLSLLVRATYNLTKKSTDSILSVIILLGSGVMTYFGFSLLWIFAASALVSALYHWKDLPFSRRLRAVEPLGLGVLAFIFLFFLKVGAFIYGGGLAMVPFIRREIVEGLGWLNTQEFLAGFAIGQATPGPVILTVAFFGYKAALSAGSPGILGSLLAGLGIMLPSFILILALSRFFRNVQKTGWLSLILKGFMPASAGSVAIASLPFFPEALQTFFAWFLMLLGIILLERIQPLWLILIYAGAGFILPANLL